MSRFYRNIRDNKGRVSLSVVLTVSLLTGVFALFMSTSAQAAALTSVKDTLSDSAPSTVSNHTIQFVTPTGVSNTGGETITLTFESGFSLGSVAFGDIDLAVDDDAACDGAFTDRTLAASAGADQWGVGVAGQVITFTGPSSGTSGIAANRCVQIQIGTNASGGTNQITNPSKTAAVGTADARSIDIGGTFGDTGTALVAIIEGVTVSVTIDETLSFSIAGVNSGSCTGDTGTPTTVTTTATTVPFGTVASSNQFYAGCQTLSVSTNAGSGYALTAEVDTALKSGANLINNTSCDSSCTETSGTAWATNTNNGLGYYCEDVSGTDCSDGVDTTSEYRRFACTGADADCDPGTGGESPVNVMQNAGSVNNSQSEIHYKLSISGTQAAGTYSNTVTYIATPTF